MDQNLPPNEPGSMPTPPEPAVPPSSTPLEPVGSMNPPGATPPSEPPPMVAPPISPAASTPPPVSAPPPRFIPPPPTATPPPISAPFPSPAPRKGGGVWKILALLLFLALGASVLLNLSNLGGKVSGSGKRGVHHKREYLEETTLEDNESKKKIAVIEIEGVISSGDSDRRGHNLVDDVRKQFKAAEKDSAVKAVILKVNSPGGEVLASDEIHNAIRDFQVDSGKPVIASMQTLAASGGYYVSAPCRWIVANDMTLTGSIGVIMHGMNFSGLMDKVGIRAETYKSGKFKDMLSPFRHENEIEPEEHEMLHALIMETYGKFTNIVATGRSEAYRANSKLKDKGRKLSDEWASYADGRVLSGTQAHDLGFVDELGDFHKAVERAEKLAGISNANLIEYREPFDFSDFFHLLGQTEPQSLKVDLGVKMPNLQPGCLYFIYRQAVQ
jgi:protease-4